MRMLGYLNWTFSLCGTGPMTEIAVRIHVDSAPQCICKFPLFICEEKTWHKEGCNEYC